MNTGTVDSYLTDGCGRCEDYQTARCKVLQWTQPLVALRAMVQAAGLAEAMKWGQPCYTVGGKNVLMLLSFRESFGVSFFKGAALPDPHGLLESAGPNAQHGRIARFTTMDELTARRDALAALIDAAVAAERAGTVLAKAPPPEVPEELAAKLASDPAVQAAWEALTPGRRRSHILHVNGAKQAATRVKRAEACAEVILAGRGFNER